MTLVWSAADWPDGAPVRGSCPGFARLPGEAPQQSVSVATRSVPSDWDLARLLEDCLTPEAAARISRGEASVAVHGRRMRPGLPLHAGDRVELLGPVTADPKAARQHRVARERAGEAGRKWRGG